MLEKISTKELVEELKEREGVKTEYAEPHQDKKLSVNGPAPVVIFSRTVAVIISDILESDSVNDATMVGVYNRKSCL